MHIAIFMRSFSGGGIERLFATLSRHFLARGHKVSFLVNTAHGPAANRLPPDIEIHALRAKKPARSVPELVSYARRHRPDVILAGHDHANLALCLAGLLMPRSVKIVASQHNTLDPARMRSLKHRLTRFLYRLLLPRASAIIAVSRGVRDDLVAIARVPPEKIRIVHNGIVSPENEDPSPDPAAEAFMASLPHPRTVIAIGRLAEAKDFPTLLRAFSLLIRRGENANLLLLGEGELRPRLAALAKSLGIEKHVFAPGVLENPFAWLRLSSVFVLSSKYEGFANVVAEALACGTPVVSTDCPHGPAEILENGRYGRLVPVGDAEAMADAIALQLAGDHDREALIRRGRWFSEERCASRYIEIFLGIDPEGADKP